MHQKDARRRLALPNFPKIEAHYSGEWITEGDMIYLVDEEWVCETCMEDSGDD